MLYKRVRISLSLVFLMLTFLVLLLNIQNLYILSPFAYIIIAIAILKRMSLDSSVQPLFFISFLGILFLIFSGAFLDQFSRLFFCTFFYYAAGFFFLHVKKKPLTVDIVSFVLFAPGILFLTVFLIRNGDIDYKPIGLAVPLAFLAVLLVGRYKVISAIAGIAVFLTISYVLYPMFIYKKYGTLTNQTDTRVMLPLIRDSDTINVHNINAKVIVLDYWYTGCGACFRRFPDLEVMHKKYANDKEVLIAAVQIPFKNEPNAKLANEWIAAYSFPRFSTLLYEDSNPWQISKFPYVLIFDKHKKLRYKGMLITEDRPLVSNTYDLIEKLKKE